MNSIKNRYNGKVIFVGDAGMTARQMLKKAIVAEINLRDADLSGAYLRDADLSDANLSGADLSDADLRDADLSDANLSGAYLRGADLSGVDLRGADLSDADLRDANLGGADLRGADLTGADLTGADLTGADLTGADGKQLPRATPEQAIANLDKVREIVLDNEARLQMNHWHGNNTWRDKTCVEEVLCGTTHCMAGWLQVCTTEPALKNIDTQLAGTLAAPVASKMFFRPNEEVLEWLSSRAYVAEIAESEHRAKDRAARRKGI